MRGNSHPSTVRPCIVHGCHNAGTSRGLCSVHYRRFAKQVRDKLTTWKDLEAAGFAVSVRGKGCNA